MPELQAGRIVRSRAGRDKDGFFVVMRNVVISSFPLNTPNVILVFPTSIVSNILILLIFTQKNISVINLQFFQKICFFPLHLFYL